MKRALVLAVANLCAVASGCGVFIDHGHSDDQPDYTPVPVPYSDPSLTTPPVTNTDGSTTFKGYVGGTFAVNVDGTAYSDMEDFYTKEETRLPDKVKAAGYDASWTAKFDAQIGFSDLWRDMTVYIAPVDPQGYQGETSVGDSGEFDVTLPATAVGHNYKVRATKRIDILLTRGETQMKICYNFSAVEQAVPFNSDSLPIELTTFTSTVTSYACDLAAGDGITVPPSTTTPTAIVAGDTKADAARILGLEGLSAQSPTQWCWAYRSTADSPCASHRDGSPCDCSVTFDANGVVTSFDNIATTYLKSP